MTTKRFLSAMYRWWYLVLIGAIVTGAVGAGFALQATTVYWARTTVTVLQPDPNPLRAEGSVLTGVASALVVRANGGPASTKTSSPETTLYGEGIRDGQRIRLRDVGRQWSTSIPDPIIDVEAVGADPERVAGRVRAMVELLERDLADIQSELKVGKGNTVFLSVEPETPNVILVRGNRARTLGGIAVLGAALTALLVYFADRRAQRRTRYGAVESVTSETPSSVSR